MPRSSALARGLTALAFAFACGLLACSPHSGPNAEAEAEAEAAPIPDPLAFGDQVVRIVVTQRGKHVIPKTQARLSLSLGDVEGSSKVEHVFVTDHETETDIVTETRMYVGDVEGFNVDGARYELHLVETDNTHLVNDTATFEVSLYRP